MNDTPTPLDERQAPSLWRNFSFQLLWTSTFASGFGDRMVQMAAWSMLGIALADAEASRIQAGVAFWFFLPWLLISGVGGWLADTLPRRLILFFCDEARAVILLTAMVLAPAGAAAAIPQAHQWKVYAIIAAVGSMAAIFSPTRAATVPLVVPITRLQSANAIVMGIAVIGSLLGLLAGDWLLKHSAAAALLAGAICFAVTGVFFLLMKLQRAQHVTQSGGSEAGRMIEAAAYIWKHRPLRQLVALNVMFWAAANVLVAAITALCKHAYGFPAEGVVGASGKMLACVGAGMLLSSLLVAAMNTRRESAWVMMGSLGVAGFSIVMLALAPTFYMALPLAFLVGLFGNGAMIVTTTLIQSIAADYIRGRVFGVREVLNTTSAVVVNGAIWLTPGADGFMVPAMYVTAAVMLLVAARGLWVELTRGPAATRMCNVFWRFCRLFSFVWHRLRVIGKHHIPSTGAVILASNHTTGMDPLLIQTGCPRVVRWVMLKSYRFWFAEPLWREIDPICLDLAGSDFAKLREVLRTLKRGEIVGLFPEGQLQRDHRDLQAFELGIGMIAARSGAAIVPVWIDGTVQSTSMFWHFMKPTHSTVTFGEPYYVRPEQSHTEVAAELRERMVALSGRSEQEMSTTS